MLKMVVAFTESSKMCYRSQKLEFLQSGFSVKKVNAIVLHENFGTKISHGEKNPFGQKYFLL